MRMQGDCTLTLGRVSDVASAVVAGVKYRVTFEMDSSCGDGRVRCAAVRIFVPLHVYCNNPTEDNPRCMEMELLPHQSCETV